jgi:hypothetical protein
MTVGKSQITIDKKKNIISDCLLDQLLAATARVKMKNNGEEIYAAKKEAIFERRRRYSKTASILLYSMIRLK